ncbi:MAG: thioredoxin [Oligoflexia bacterium]|nr:thioredoxin [Oligoflexia bacterium]
MSGLQQVDNASFDSVVLKSSNPVLVDFWAEWCGPCRAIAPILEEISKEMGATVNIVKVNVDQSPELATKYGIRGIPTLIFFKNGQIKKTLVGNQGKGEIVKTLQELA